MKLQVTADGLNVHAAPDVKAEIWDTLEKGRVVEVVPLSGWVPIPMEDGTIGWCVAKYLTEPTATPTAPIPAPVTPSINEPIWIRWARSKLGIHEVPGPADNPEIASWYHLTTLPPDMWHDSTAWCAIFVNAAFMLNNIKTIRSARAVDWLTFGMGVDDPQDGDVVVFEWTSGGHHVNFYLADAGEGRIKCIGGNQSDAVTISNYPKANVMGYRRALV